MYKGIATYDIVVIYLWVGLHMDYKHTYVRTQTHTNTHTHTCTDMHTQTHTIRIAKTLIYIYLDYT